MTQELNLQKLRADAGDPSVVCATVEAWNDEWRNLAAFQANQSPEYFSDPAFRLASGGDNNRVACCCPNCGERAFAHCDESGEPMGHECISCGLGCGP